MRSPRPRARSLSTGHASGLKAGGRLKPDLLSTRFNRGLVFGVRLCQPVNAMIVGASLTEDGMKAFKARRERELGAGWCVEVYRCQGRLVARAYYGKRGPKKGAKYRIPSQPPQGAAGVRSSGRSASPQPPAAVSPESLRSLTVVTPESHRSTSANFAEVLRCDSGVTTVRPLWARDGTQAPFRLNAANPPRMGRRRKMLILNSLGGSIGFLAACAGTKHSFCDEVSLPAPTVYCTCFSWSRFGSSTPRSSW